VFYITICVYSGLCVDKCAIYRQQYVLTQTCYVLRSVLHVYIIMFSVYTSMLYVDVFCMLITVECVVSLQVCCMFTNELRVGISGLCWQSETHLREKLLVKSAAEFLVMQQIPSFVSTPGIPPH